MTGCGVNMHACWAQPGVNPMPDMVTDTRAHVHIQQSTHQNAPHAFSYVCKVCTCPRVAGRQQAVSCK
jgi:hypothetical protein